MDGVFVSNVTWGSSTVKAIRKLTSLPLDVHLMIEKPERLLDCYLETKADIIIIHPESTKALRKTLLKIKSFGAKAGVALKLETSVDCSASRIRKHRKGVSEPYCYCSTYGQYLTW